MSVAARGGASDVRSHEPPRPSGRGKLTIFFGAAPGAGKTSAMVEAARSEARDRGRDVVVGAVDASSRQEIAALLVGLEAVQGRATVYGELDLDAALNRRPGLLLVSRLAHINAPGGRHYQRWQDVEELLDSGIDVFTTLDVAHLESLSDRVPPAARGEATVPDSIFDRAHEIRLVDLSPQRILGRLRARRGEDGDASPPLREIDLLALRELSLRRMTERVQGALRRASRAGTPKEVFPSDERVLVCVTASPRAMHLVRAARRLATSLHAELLGVHVEATAALRLPGSDRGRITRHLRHVESLGGEATIVRGENAPEAVVRFARDRGVTKIVAGKPSHPRWRDFWRRSFLDEVVRRSRDVDVYVISGEPSEPETAIERSSTAEPPSARSIAGYAAATIVVTTSALVSWFVFEHSQLADVAMVFLLGVIVVSMQFGYGASLLAAALSAVTFDFFFIPPYFSFAIANLRHIVTFAMMLFVAFVVSHLTRRIREQADAARMGERRTASLFSMSREIGLAHSPEALVEAAARQAREAFGAQVGLFVPDAAGRLEIAIADADAAETCRAEMGIAEWAWKHQREAGAGTDAQPTARAQHVPLRGPRGPAGVLTLVPLEPSRARDPDERRMLETFTGLVGAALERMKLADEARRARLDIETEQLRNALLSSVSHDLRTPLGVITGATSTLLEPEGPLDEPLRRRLLWTAHDEALRLNRLVANLLGMTRLEAGAIRLHKEPQSMEEVVGAALTRLEDPLHRRPLSTYISDELPLVPFDPVLVEQVLVNLLDNAVKYTPPETAIEIASRLRDGYVETEVADHGPGVAPDEAERIFAKFYRAREREGGGAGLGLTICRGIVQAHGGSIWVEPRPGGGASFRFTLPLGPAEAGDETEPSREDASS